MLKLNIVLPSLNEFRKICILAEIVEFSLGEILKGGEKRVDRYKVCVKTAVEFPLSASVIKTRVEKYAWTLLSSSSTVSDHFFTSSKFNASKVHIF